MRSLTLDKEQMKEMAAVDIRTVNAEELVDIMTLDGDFSGKESTSRIRKFIQAVRNPYCFRVGETVVKSSFSGNVSLQQRIQEIVDGI